jgi:hypothetical protein
MNLRVIKNGLSIGILTEDKLLNAVPKMYNLYKFYSGKDWLHAPFYEGNNSFNLGATDCYLRVEPII